MLRLRLAVIAAITAALAGAPAVAHATVSSSQINSWVSSLPGTPDNSQYLMSFDNPQGSTPPTSLTVSGTVQGASPGDHVDIVCFYGSGPTAKKWATAPVSGSPDGTFTTGAVPLKPIAGHACRLRAIPSGAEGTGDAPQFAGPQVAISEAALPAAAIAAGPNHGVAYNIYVNDVTFSGFAAWAAAGVTPGPHAIGCGGPYMAPIDPAYNLGNFAIDCAGALMPDDLGTFGGRSEVQVDGHNAYDAAAAQALFQAAGGNPASQALSGFPQTLTSSVSWDPSSGLISSTSDESWVACNGPNEDPQTFATCPNFVDTGVQLQRVITTSAGGRVVTMTDTWSSTDGSNHTLDLLYDDYVGVAGNGDGERGFEFPGQSAFSQYTAGDSVPGPTTTPGSILTRTNVSAPDGAPSEAFGAITFSSAPSEFRFASNSELEEHNLLSVPAGGSASLTYVYSVGYSQADVQGLGLTAQDHFQAPALAITSPGNGATFSTPSATVTGTASSGSGITALTVGGQPVAVGPGGTWSAQVPLNPGANTITAVATDGAGVTAQTEVTLIYQPPSAPPPPAPPASPPPPTVCKVPRTRGMKLPAVKRALRHAHCRVGRIVWKHSKTVRRGRVITTIPHVGRRARADSRVEVFISKGR